MVYTQIPSPLFLSFNIVFPFGSYLWSVGSEGMKGGKTRLRIGERKQNYLVSSLFKLTKKLSLLKF